MLRPLASARFQVLFHSPSRGASHLSLTVLVRYRSSAVFSLAGWSRGFGQDSTCPALLRCRIGLPRLARTGVSPSAPSLSRKFRFVRQSISPVLQPRTVRERSGLGSSLFDRHYWGNRLFLSPPPGTKMFQFPGFAPDTVWCTAFSRAGCPIRKRPDQILFANPRTFSQLTASFFACRSQGILRAL